MPTLDSPGLVDALRSVVVATLPEVLAVPEALTPALFAVDPTGATPLSMPFLVLLCGEPRGDTDTAVWCTKLIHPVEFLYVARTDGDGATDTAQTIRGKLDALIRALQTDYHLTIGGSGPCGRVTLTEVIAPAMNRTNAVQQMIAEAGFPVTAMSLLMEFTVVTSWYEEPSDPSVLPAPSIFLLMSGAAGANEVDTVYAHTFTAIGGVGSDPAGAIGAARSFAAANSQYLTYPNAAANTLTIPSTIGGWYKLTNTSTDHVLLFKGKNVSTAQSEFALIYEAASGRMRFSLFGTSTWSVQGPPVISGAWTCFVASWDGATLAYAENGGAFTTTPAGFPTSKQDGALTIGSGSPDSPRYWQGSVDAIGIWKGRVQSFSQWQDFFNGGAGREFQNGEWG